MGFLSVSSANTSKDISFTGATCIGGHGISIGSVGGRSDNTVENVTVENCSIQNSQNGMYKQRQDDGPE